MALADLFKTLTAVDEDVKDSCQPAFNHRRETENGMRGPDRKKKDQGEQTGLNMERCFQNQTTRTKESPEAEDVQRHCASTRFNQKMKKQHRNTADFNKACQQVKNKSNCNVNKQQKKMRCKQRNLHQQTERQTDNQHTRLWGRKDGGGGKKGRGRKDRKSNIKQELPHKRFMTQEFKEQNALEVDGRLLCQHFIWGRCIKGDECQLEHVEAYNGLIKEVCKFYVQGCCLKGERCPYMHNILLSFPCKFFHRKGKCHREDCKFSHDPLNDITEKLLDEAIKRENDLNEIAKERDRSSGKPEKTQVSELTEENQVADLFFQPIRPNFYNSSDANMETEADQAEERVDVTEEVTLLHVGNDAPSPSLNPEGPVCYSVEAVLRPQSKQFYCFTTTPGRQESVPQTSYSCASDSANPSKVPYSVSAVLRSCKSADGATSSSKFTPVGQTEDVSDPVTSSENKNDECWVNNRYEPIKLSCQMNTDKCTDLTVVSVDKDKLSGDVAQSLNPNHNVKSQLDESSSKTRGIDEGHSSPVSSALCLRKEKRHLPVDVADCKDKTPHFKVTFSNFFTQSSLKPNLSDSDSSIKPFSTSSVFREFNGRVNVSTKPSDTENSHSKHFTAKQHHFTEAKAKSSCKITCGGNVHRSENPTTPFCSLFASSIIDSQQPVGSSSGTKGFNQSFSPALSHTDLKSPPKHVKSEPDKSSLSFLSPSASCLRASAADHLMTSSLFHELNQPPHNISQSIDPRLGSPVDLLSDISAKNKNEDSLTELVNQPKRQLENSVSDSCSESPDQAPDLSTCQAVQQQDVVSSCKSPAASVLRSLFLSLSPYQQDGPQRDSVPSECEMPDKSCAVCL